MSSNNEREKGTVRVLADRIQINNRDIEPAVVQGLTGAGFDVEIEPELVQGSVIKAYRKVSK